MIVLFNLMGVFALFLSCNPTPIAASETRDPGINPPAGNLETFPVGSYHCLEYEWGFIWNREDLVLLEDGTSLYLYGPQGFPHLGIWVYTPTTQLISLTNFYWNTLNVTPDLLWASRTIHDFEIAIQCTPRKEDVNIQITSHTPEPSEVGAPITVTFSMSSTFPGFYGGPVIVRADTGEMCHDPWAGLTGSCMLTILTPGERTLTAIFPGSYYQPSGFSLATDHSVISLPFKIFLPILKRE